MPEEKKTLGLYLHIPFCRSKCIYCDFYSLAGREEAMDRYVQALLLHLEREAPRAAGYRVDTVYFGGGTPSLLGPRRLTALLEGAVACFSLAEGAEVTMEGNPESCQQAEELRALRRSGFNRLSLGLQSANDGELRRLGRIHTFAQGRSAVAAARAAGFANLSLDLMYGLPGHTMAGWLDTLDRVLALEPDHLSCYGLRAEEGTPLWRQRDTLPDDEVQADLYLTAVERLAAAGLEQYEISNFARPGFESRHNLRYWRLSPYLGFGPGAHSDFGGCRFAWPRDLEGYLQAVPAGTLAPEQVQSISPEERLREYVMLSLRTARGLEERRFRALGGGDFAPLARAMAPLAAAALAEETAPGCWRLTPRGFLVSNTIITTLWEALEASAPGQP